MWHTYADRYSPICLYPVFTHCLQLLTDCHSKVHRENIKIGHWTSSVPVLTNVELLVGSKFDSIAHLFLLNVFQTR